MGKLLPVPYPEQSMDEYREQLVNFKKNYWSFLKPSKVGNKFIPLPPEHLKPKEIKPNIIPAIAASNKRKNKPKEMSRKLNEHVEEELFNKEKRVLPKPPQSEPRVIKEGEQPVKKKKPYYRKKYNKPKPVEVVIPEPKDKFLFVKGLIVGSVITAIICHIINSI
jgi:hypothetical protein